MGALVGLAIFTRPGWAVMLAQDYPDFEVIVIDDQSTDATRAILAQIAEGGPQLKILDGSPPSEGWLGKNWACFQLAQQAQGDLQFFTSR